MKGILSIGLISVWFAGVAQINNPPLLKKNRVDVIIESFTTTDKRVTPTETHTFIDTLGFKTKSTEYLKDGSNDSTLTVYHYNDAYKYMGDVTTSNYGFSSEYVCLDSVTFSHKTNFKGQSYSSLIRLKYEGRTKYTYVNDTLTEVHSCRHTKARMRCRTIYYDRNGRRSRIAHATYFYNQAKQLYKLKRHSRTVLFHEAHIKRHSRYLAHYFYDEAGLLKRVTGYSSFTGSSSVTNYTYRKRPD